MAIRTDREKTAHLLRRFALGASETELDYYCKDSYEGAVARLLAYEGVENPSIPLEAMKPEGNNNIPMPLLQVWWLAKFATSRTPLVDKMALFWHDHFATSAQKVTGSMMMYRQIQIFLEHGVGKFQTLLAETSKDPAMLFWLDNQDNVKGKPNENFAREIMELFTLGYGNYSEKDIQEAARAFTGWTISRRGRPLPTQISGKLPPGAQFYFDQQKHDDGIKEVLGNKGAFTGDDVIGILCGNPRTTMYITEKIWNFFVYPDPDAQIIERHAKVFRESGLDIKALLRSIMLDPEFTSDKAERSIYKNPADFCLSTLRQVGIGTELLASLGSDGKFDRPKSVSVVAAQQAMKSMGMDLLFPPDVSGWDGGKAWITSATMVERIQWADRLFPAALGGGGGGAPRSRKAIVRFAIFPLIADNPTPKNLVDTLISVLDAPIPSQQRPALLAAANAKGSTYNAASANQAANAVARLIFGSPEFQFA